MKVAVILNTIDRSNITPRIIDENLSNAGHPIHKVMITDNGSKEEKIIRWVEKRADLPIFNKENVGNAEALNYMLMASIGQGYDVICKLDNDIELPKNWLKKAVQALKDQQVGLVGFHCVATKPEAKYNANGVNLLIGSNVFSCWVFHRRLVGEIGYFSTFSKYGLWDSDYNKRARLAGFINGYIEGMDSEHKGHDVEENSPYRKMKDEELKKAEILFKQRWKQLSEDRYFVTPFNELI